MKKELATIISELTGLQIIEENVSKSVRRYYYIQEAQPGYAYLLHHYRGPFFVEINEKDWAKMESGELSVKEYVEATKWLYGYYWGGGSMCSGGFYTQLESQPGIHDKELIQHTMNIVSKIGWHNSSGAKVTDQDIEEWNKLCEKYFHDPRVEYFKAIASYIKDTFGAECKGFTAGTGLKDNEILLSPNMFDRTFEIFAGDDIIWKLLTKERSIPNTENLKYEILQGFGGKKSTVVSTAEEFQKVLVDLGIQAEWESFEARVRKNEEHRKTTPVKKEKDSLLQKFLKLFKAS